jgi:hypothetical protein
MYFQLDRRGFDSAPGHHLIFLNHCFICPFRHSSLTPKNWESFAFVGADVSMISQSTPIDSAVEQCRKRARPFGGRRPKASKGSLEGKPRREETALGERGTVAQAPWRAGNRGRGRDLLAGVREIADRGQLRRGHLSRLSAWRSVHDRREAFAKPRLGSPLIPEPLLKSGRITWPACRAPGLPLGAKHPIRLSNSPAASH